MQPLITLVTLGVDDLEKSLRFYRDGLGFSTERIVGDNSNTAPSLFFNCRRACVSHSGREKASRRCEDCHAEKLVAFSCQGRGFCPSCGARRMAETAALLTDEVLPRKPLRQRVLSLRSPCDSCSPLIRTR